MELHQQRAGEGGLRRGDVVRGINEEPTLSLKTFSDKYNDLTTAGTEKVLLTVGRFGSTKFVLIKIKDHDTEDENR